jgi:hypothetical protein
MLLLFHDSKNALKDEKPSIAGVKRSMAGLNGLSVYDSGRSVDV